MTRFSFKKLAGHKHASLLWRRKKSFIKSGTDEMDIHLFCKLLPS
jgi:hypothetical protein